MKGIPDTTRILAMIVLVPFLMANALTHFGQGAQYEQVDLRHLGHDTHFTQIAPA